MSNDTRDVDTELCDKINSIVHNLHEIHSLCDVSKIAIANAADLFGIAKIAKIYAEKQFRITF